MSGDPGEPRELDRGVRRGGASSPAGAGHSSSIAISPDGATVYVVNADSDSISVIDTRARTLTAEIPLGAGPPVADPTSGAYAPVIMPRMLALSSDARTLYVSGERSGMLYAVDLVSAKVTKSVAVGSEPIGVVVGSDGSIFVACSQDATVVRVDAGSFTVAGTATMPAEPWALAFASDGTLLATQFLGPGVTTIDPSTMAVGTTWTIPDTAPRGDQRLAHGQVRGLYDVVVRPGTTDLWVAHAMLGTDTPQPALDFESTAFPSLSILRADGTYVITLSTDAQDVAGVDGSFADVVSGPHHIEFTKDGDFALVVDTNSEDILAVDANARVESSLLRPLPGHMPEGIVLSPDEQFAYVDERNTGDIAVLSVTRSGTGIQLAVDGAVIPRFASDSMPATLRFGQHLFYSANSDEYPITQNHWIACATCHMEGRSDAVTWKFAQGPRDTPSNAGGMLGTGFLFRTADRNEVQDYWHTINIEQGGNFDPTAQATLLDAITAYVNKAIPLPIPPATDPTLVAAGAAIFARPDVGCAGCHSGPRFTDSGAGNPTLDLAGPARDVSQTTDSPTWPTRDVDGDPRAACRSTRRRSPDRVDAALSSTTAAPRPPDVLEQTCDTMGDISVPVR